MKRKIRDYSAATIEAFMKYIIRTMMIQAARSGAAGKNLSTGLACIQRIRIKLTGMWKSTYGRLKTTKV